jgi:coenzyme F420-reducing hydrogenase delta subunit
MSFEPKIIGFLCNWCSYAGADLCGVSRFQYPTNIRVVRTMCSARIDPEMIFQVFKQGADGIMVGGCHIGDCHYITGNYHTEMKVALTHRLMEKAGLEPERLRLEWVSAAEGQRFADVVADFTSEVAKLGQNPLTSGKSKELKEAVEAAADSAGGFRARAIVGNEYRVTKLGNVYGETIPQERIDELWDGVVDEEFTRNQILGLTREKPSTVEELSKSLGLPPKDVLEQVVALWSQNRLEQEGITGDEPIYRVAGGA